MNFSRSSSWTVGERIYALRHGYLRLLMTFTIWVYKVVFVYEHWQARGDREEISRSLTVCERSCKDFFKGVQCNWTDYIQNKFRSDEFSDTTMDFLRSNSWTVGERICAAFVPFTTIIEALILAVTDCFSHRPRPWKVKRRFDYADLSRLADESRFTVNEVEALFELFKKLSSLIVEDGSIHKEELQVALLQTPHGENLFLDRVFDLFDEKRTGVIEFDGFVHALSVFHPYAPLEEKIDFAFRLYDIRQTGYIDQEEVKQMVIAIMMELDIKLSDELLQAIIDKTFADVDLDKDGRISKEEWKDFAIRHPTLLKNMTLPNLKDVSTIFPSFVED